MLVTAIGWFLAMVSACAAAMATVVLVGARTLLREVVRVYYLHGFGPERTSVLLWWALGLFALTVVVSAVLCLSERTRAWSLGLAFTGAIIWFLAIEIIDAVAVARGRHTGR
jgi:hypothetical protein